MTMASGNSSACVFCGNSRVTREEAPYPHTRCDVCGHLQRLASVSLDHYRQSSGRNKVPAAGLLRKHRERFEFAAPQLRRATRILEVGCAEGAFGEYVKERMNPPAYYCGIEISADAGSAVPRLDHVHTGTLDTLPPDEAPFDLVFCLHVLEHLDEPIALLNDMRRRLTSAGRIILEVPNGSGNAWMPWDANPEHLHAFSVSSATLACQRAGLSVERVESRGFESPIYNDGLRIQARQNESCAKREAALTRHLSDMLGDRYIVWGIGGDYQNHLRPYLRPGAVAYFVDGNPAKIGSSLDGVRVCAPDALRELPPLPILIATFRFQDEISDILLRRYAVDAKRIFGLDRLLEWPDD